MANEKQLAILKASVEGWNKWQIEEPGTKFDLTGADLRKAYLGRAYLHRADLSNANLSEANLSHAILSEANLRGADLSNADLWKAALHRADLRKANLSEAKLKGANLSEANLRDAYLREADLSEANLTQADMFHAKLNDANLWRAKLTDVNLNQAWLPRAKLIEADLSGADLREANFEDVLLNMANLEGAKLTRAKFVGANLHGASLAGADLSGADFSQANLLDSNLSGANLSEASLIISNLVRTNVNNVTLSRSRVYGINVWDLRGDFKEQKDLIITPFDKSNITVDNIKVAQFVYLILNNKEIRDVINTLTSKTVLILGRFTVPERKTILDAMKNKLREFDLLPIVFDFERPADKDFTETIKTLAGLCYFVIADVTNPKSSPLELQAAVPDYQIPFVPIIQEGEQPFAMMVDLQKKYNWVLPTRTYSSKDALISKLKVGIIDPAMQKHNELRLIKAQRPDTVSLG